MIWTGSLCPFLVPPSGHLSAVAIPAGDTGLRPDRCLRDDGYRRPARRGRLGEGHLGAHLEGRAGLAVANGTDFDGEQCAPHFLLPYRKPVTPFGVPKGNPHAPTPHP